MPAPISVINNHALRRAILTILDEDYLFSNLRLVFFEIAIKERLDYHEEKVFRVARVQIGAKDVLINDFHKTNKSIIREQLLLLWDSNETYLERAMTHSCFFKQA